MKRRKKIQFTDKQTENNGGIINTNLCNVKPEDKSFLPVEPKVTTRLTEDCLVIVMHFLVADPARVDGRSVGVLGVEDHWLVGRVNLKLMCESGTYARRIGSKIFG